MISRRSFLAGCAALFLPPRAFALGSGLAETGLVPDAAGDQSALLQEALDKAADAGRALVLPMGRFRVSDIWLPEGAVLSGMPGTVLEAAGEAPILTIDGAGAPRVTGLTFRGNGAVSEGGLVEVTDCAALSLVGCRFTQAGGRGLVLFEAGGRIAGNRFDSCRGAAIASLDATGLAIEGNVIRECDNLGIYVERQDPGPDGTIIRSNRISAIRWGEGGNGPNGNAINAYRTGGVIIDGNVIDDCAFSAIRLNATENAIVTGNLCTRSQEVAIFAEFGFSGAVIADNIIDAAATGIAITNYDTGGHLATCSGNIIRNISARSPTNPETTPVGISAEADTLVTGNLVENVPGVGLALGWGPYLRNVSAIGNVIRDCQVGIGVSVVDGAGPALVAGNLVSVPANNDGIVGMEWGKVVARDLVARGSEYPFVTLTGNRLEYGG